MLHSGEKLCNRYEIIKVIGKGGMSTVYQARDLNTGRLLAIKDVDRNGSESNQVVEQSLAAEGRMLVQLNNQHLPRIYDIIENSENFMLVMDFIQGESLDIVLKREGAQPMERVLDWGMQICEVLSYLHSQPTPIIYRDMKPANVMLQPNGQLMMIDFGTARTQKVGVAMQADTICIGTAGFAAPEQFGGIGQSTPKTDIFCLGATLYNMITGHSPCDYPAGILPLEKWDPKLANVPLGYIINKCTRNDPDERYQTAVELREDLYRARTGSFVFPTKGKSGPLTGGFRKQSWQKQNTQKSDAMSGLLQRGLSGLLPKQEANREIPASAQVERQTVVPARDWQTNTPIPVQAPVRPNAWMQETVQKPAGMTLWRKLILIVLLLAATFVVFAVLLLTLEYQTAAIIFLLFGMLAALLAVVGIWIVRKETN